MPAYSGAIQPYMFEPTMTPDAAAAHVVMKVKSAFNDRRFIDISTWYAVDLLMLENITGPCG
jgi:hypothetical protein